MICVAESKGIQSIAWSIGKLKRKVDWLSPSFAAERRQEQASFYEDAEASL